MLLVIPDYPSGRTILARWFASGSAYGQQVKSLDYGREARVPRRRKAPAQT